jgi:hypothetical protein
MVKFYAKDEKGALVGLGITRGNVDRLREGKPILIVGGELDPSLEGTRVLIFYGETEKQIHDAMKRLGITAEKESIDPAIFQEKPGIPGDEGQLQIVVTADAAHGVIRVDFGKPVTWLGLTESVARTIAAALVTHADALAKTDNTVH